MSFAFSSLEQGIVAVGETSLYCVSEAGALRSSQRLGYYPSCAHAYPVVSKDRYGDAMTLSNLLVGTHSKSVCIFRNNAKIWEASVASAPVALQVGTFGGLRGLLVVLDDAGHLRCCYLGTDPATSVVVGAPEARDLNYERMDQELLALQKTINEHEVGSGVGGQRGGRVGVEKLTLSVQVSKGASSVEAMSLFERAGVAEMFENASVVNLQLRYVGAEEALHDVKVSFHAEEPLFCSHQ